MGTVLTRWSWLGGVLLASMASMAVAQDRDRDRDEDDRPAADREERDFHDERPGMGPRLVPPRPDRPEFDARWYLGVEVEYRNYGAVITRVRRSSPAQRAGLEPRDVIVTVRGYQVGHVNHQLYPLERELDLRADRRGNVLLLVQNHRDGTLMSTPVRLEPFRRPLGPPRGAPLIGTVTARGVTRLPRGAVLTVRLVDITDAQPAPIAQQRYTDLGPLPIPFELDYDADQIEPGRSYALQAAVTINGLPTYHTQRYRVFQDGAPRRVDMVLESSR